MDKLTAIGQASNDGAEAILAPYSAIVTIQGVAPILFHAWSNEAVAEQAAAAKGSKAKKSDNLESYVHRLENGNIGIPGTYLTGAIIGAARYRQDPRSPRKSAMDLFKAGVVPLTDIADLGAKDWDYVDRRRVQIQRNAITRERPAMRAGWRATFELQVLLPEYILASVLNDTIQAAGRLIGLADFRPTFGRFQVVEFRES